jgi:hypothetical protein
VKEFETPQTYVPGRPILTYFRRLFVASDQLLNVIFGGDEGKRPGQYDRPNRI